MHVPYSRSTIWKSYKQALQQYKINCQEEIVSLL